MKILKNNNRKLKQSLTYFLAILFLSALILSVLSPVQAFAAVSDFRYCAPITVNDSAASYNLLELTDEVLGQIQTGSPDLRIYSGDEEIPYAMVTEHDYTATAKVERAEILNQGKDNQGNLYFEVLISTGQWVRQLTVISSDKNLIRKVKVEGSHNQREWLTLTEDSTIFDLTDEQKPDNNQDNPTLNIRAMNIKGSNPLLVFSTDRTKETILFWGNSQIKAPVYDIQKFKSNLDYSKTPRASLGHAGENKKIISLKIPGHGPRGIPGCCREFWLSSWPLSW